jgi:anti-anti-sigma factor
VSEGNDEIVTYTLPELPYGSSLQGRVASSRDRAFVELRGTVDADSGTALARAFDELISGGVTSLCVDVSAIASVEGAGARAFAFTASKLEALGGRFRVRNAPASVEELFSRTGLGRLLIASDPRSASQAVVV